jgi:hypothetical protein
MRLLTVSTSLRPSSSNKYGSSLLIMAVGSGIGSSFSLGREVEVCLVEVIDI